MEQQVFSIVINLALSFIYIGEIYRDFVYQKRYGLISHFAMAGQQQ
jgi:hypothetical protein